MEFLNKFIKGAISDLDYLLRDGTVWTFPTVNARVFNLEGQGLVITNVDGNQEAFSVTDGFTIIGAAEYGSILYLVTTDGTYTEIGTYPSVSVLESTNTSFVNEYKLLRNLYPDELHPPTPGNFRTSELGYTKKRLEVIAKLDYDDTVNLYICDHINPNRVINSGFKQNGNWIGETRNYTYDDFRGAINQISSTNNNINALQWTLVDGGGRLKPGNYFIYIRLSTKDYARTTFFNYCGPIPVNEGNDMIHSQGQPEKNIVNGLEFYTTKKISLSIDIDNTGYDYFELAVIRYSADYDFGLAKPNSYLIGKQYPITTTSITLTGLEPEEQITPEEIVVPQPSYSICKSQIETAGCYLGANWKKKEVDYDALAAYALSIKVYSDFGDAIVPTFSLWSVETGENMDAEGYKDPVNYEKIGYFKEQIYPFGIVFMFDDNTESDVYPVTGNIDGLENSKGLLKCQSPGTGISHLIDEISVCYIYFNNDDAIEYYNHPDNADRFVRVIGYRYVRGERIDNLICQGVTLPCYDHIFTRIVDDNWNPIDPPVYYNWGINQSDTEGWTEFGDSYCIPLVEGLMPLAIQDPFQEGDEEDKYYYDIGVDDAETVYGFEDHEYWVSEYVMDEDQQAEHFMKRYIETDENGSQTKIKYGVFSPDINFTENPVQVSNVFIRLVRNYTVSQDDSFYRILDDEGIKPRYIGIEFNLGTSGETHFAVTGDAAKPKEVNARFIDTFVQKGEDMFTSWTPAEAAKYTIYENEEVRRIHYNRSYRTSRYIGITDENDWSVNVPLFDYKYHIVNLYKQDPTVLESTIVDSYEVFASEYKLISNSLRSLDESELVGVNYNQYYNGDCFLQKSYMRVGRYYGFEKPGVKNDPLRTGRDGEDYEDRHGNFYQHGMYLGVVTENKYNADLRNDVYTKDENQQPLTYTYLPRAIRHYGSIKRWVTFDEDAAIEAMQVNDGYNITRPEKIYVGYDANRDYNNELTKPNRVSFSYRDIAGSIRDGYRQFGLSSYMDYNTAGGPITKLCNIEDFLCIIQRQAIIQIAVDEKVLETSSGISQLVIGTSVKFLSDQFKILADYGSQHQFAVYATDRSIYGIDFNKRILWHISPQRASTGGIYLQAEDMGLKYNAKSQIEELFDLFINGIGIVTGLPDETIEGEGCFIGYDKKYKEVLFCFVGTDGGRSVSTILVFSELINAFVGTYDFTTRMFINLDNNLFSIRIVGEQSSEQVYIHNASDYPTFNGERQTFYGDKLSFQLSFVITGLIEGQNVSNFRKIFEALMIDMNHEELTSILYETEYQSSMYTFTVGTEDLWKNSEYIEHAWQVPVYVQTSIREQGEDEYEDSELRGRWMKVTITYYPNSTVEEIFIRSVISKFTLSIA